MSTIVLPPNPNPARTRNVLISVPDWGDAATWAANLTPEAGSSLANLTTKQPSQVAGFDVDPTALVLTGTATRAPLDVVSVILANATTAATWSVGVGDSSNEAIGTHAADGSGNARHGTLAGAAVFDPDGKYTGGVLVPNAAGASADHIATAAFGAFLSGVTYAGWFQVASLSDEQVLFGTSAAFSHRLVVQTDGHVRFGDTCISAATLVPGYWYHVAVTHEGGDSAQLFIDGAPDTSDGATPYATGAIGVTWGGASGYRGLTGRMDDLRVYESVLTGSQIQLEMQSETPSATTALHYRLNGYQSGSRTFGVPPNLATYTRRSAFLFLPSRLTAGIVRITITDSTNPGPLRIGRLFAGTAWQPTRNFDWGYQFTGRDDSKDTHTPSGLTLTDPRVVVPGFEFQLEHVPRLEMLANGYELRRTLGTSRECLVCLDPEEADHMEAMLLYGKLTDLGAIQPVYYDGWRMRWQVEALL